MKSITNSNPGVGPPLPPELHLKIEIIPVAQLSPYARNARVHSKKQINQLAASIRRFGFVVPILIDGEQLIVAGHGRFAAAQVLGMTDVPAIRLDHLTPAERRAYAIADNRLAELSHFDDELLALELKELDSLDLDFPLEITGFEGARLDGFLDPPTPSSDPADQVPENSGPPVTRLSDVWILGSHRLVCGDARSPETYAALMGDERVLTT